VALLAVASPASAASTISVPSTLNLTSKVLVNVPVTYDCPLFSGSFFPTSFGSVGVEQAAGHGIAQGSAYLQFTCDGLAHTQVVSVTAGTSGGSSAGVPFRGGQAIAEASLTDCGPNPINPFSYVCDNASTGWQAVRLTGGS
jgi:hypothetical protein